MNKQTALELLDEVLGEIDDTRKPRIEDVLDAPFPEEAVLVGVATDDIPVLINIHDPKPILIVGDFDFRVIKRSIEILETKIDIVEITDSKMYTEEASNTILSLASWAHGRRGGRPTIVLVENLALLKKQDFDCDSNFKYLLANCNRPRITIVAKSKEKTPYDHYFTKIEQVGDLYRLEDGTLFFTPEV